ncbi:hypothetical protein RM697_08195 [Ichthyenterobacterium sp. W332]|uniref:Lipoprotein n=1 Tax=Microcosmobacter mediterraneus TaxID=3075607 RepID=A0ABU2YKC2_9FLAO|nr:hypothetical protein [Ichthyenterobacterium sp. W332]MDT0558623.1 hypothetical protein [Ichthyenterobacterium sp. W332]
MRKIIWFLVLVLIVSCEEKQNESSEDVSQEEKTQSVISKITIEKLEYQDYILDIKAKELIHDWPKYQELMSQIELLKEAEFSFFKADKETIKALINDLKAEIPETVNSKPVKSRIVVVETSILKLHNELNLDNPKRDELLQSITEVLSAMSNLNLQVNKKIEFDANNIDRPE